MFLILLGAFFVAFASSVIATLRHGERNKRRRLRACNVHCRILHDGSLAAAATCHNLVSGLRSANPKITLDTSQYETMRNDESCLVLIMVLPESLPDLPPCSLLPLWCIPLCPPALQLSVADLDKWLAKQAADHYRRRWFRPLGISQTTELAEPHLLEAYCQAIVTQIKDCPNYWSATSRAANDSNMMLLPMTRLVNTTGRGWCGATQRFLLAHRQMSGHKDLPPASNVQLEKGDKKVRIYTRTGDKGNNNLCI